MKSACSRLLGKLNVARYPPEHRRVLSIQCAKCIEHRFPWTKKSLPFTGANDYILIWYAIMQSMYLSAANPQTSCWPSTGSISSGKESSSGRLSLLKRMGYSTYFIMIYCGLFLTSLRLLMSVYGITLSPGFPIWGHTYSKMLKSTTIVTTQIQGWVLTFLHMSKRTQLLCSWDRYLSPLSSNLFTCKERKIIRPKS